MNANSSPPAHARAPSGAPPSPTLYVVLGGLLALGVAGLAAATQSGQEAQWLTATRWTARSALLLFALAYTCKRTVDRRGFGLGFAAAHFVHAGAFSGYIVLFNVERGWFSTVGGIVGYALLTAMLVSSVRGGGGGLRRWGMRYLWVVFAFSYLGRVLENGDRRDEGWFGLTILLAIPAVRLLRSRSAASPVDGNDGGMARITAAAGRLSPRTIRPEPIRAPRRVTTAGVLSEKETSS